MELRPYQRVMLDAVRGKMRGGATRVVLGAPTGSGKTACAAQIIKAANRRGNRALFIADRLSLVRQTLERLAEWDVEAQPWYGGMRLADSPGNVVATYQTWAASKPPGDFQLIVVDECHVRVGDGSGDKPQTADAVLSHYGCWAVGLTATPFHSNMSKVWNAVVYPTTTDQLMREGHLAPPKVWTPAPMDTAELPLMSTGEWHDGDLAQRLDLVVDDVVGSFEARVRSHFNGECPKTLIYAPSAGSCSKLAELFEARTGRPFRAISYLNDGPENDEVIKGFRGEKITGLVSRDMVGRGFDVPDVRMVVMARPFRKSLAEVVQQVGRGMRSAPGKAECHVHDHAGNFLRFGAMIDAFFRLGVEGFMAPKRKGSGEPPTKTCPECHLLVPAQTMVCPECGHKFEPRRAPATKGAFAEWMRAAQSKDEIARIGVMVLDEIGDERFRAALVAASDYGRADAERIARRASAAYYDVARRRCPAARFMGLEPEPEHRVEALCRRSRKLWKDERDWKAAQLSDPEPAIGLTEALL